MKYLVVFLVCAAWFFAGAFTWYNFYGQPKPSKEASLINKIQEMAQNDYGLSIQYEYLDNGFIFVKMFGKPY